VIEMSCVFCGGFALGASGDPTLFEEYWLSQATEATVIPSWQSMSYFAHRHNSFLFVDYYLEQAIRNVHSLVGNAVSEGRFLVLGVGSTQLYQAALFALASSSSAASPTSVVSTTPHYSVHSYPLFCQLGLNWVSLCGTTSPPLLLVVAYVQ